MSTKLICIEHTRQRNGARSSRRAVTLLELVIASSMLAVVVTSLTLVMRTARTVWESNDNEYAALHHAHTVARHFVRQAREAKGVTNLSASGSSITLEMRDGNLQTWSHVGRSGEFSNAVLLTLSATGEQIPLAYDIRELSFTGYKADGLTVTADADEMRLIEVAVTVSLPRGSEPLQTVNSNVWIRSW